MADLYPSTGIFDELEFLRFSDSQFASELDSPEHLLHPQQSVLFADTLSETDVNGSSESPRKLTELKAAIASCTVGIYHRTGVESGNDSMASDTDEKTLNEINIDNVNELNQVTSSCSAKITEEADFTSSVSLSAAEDEMSPGPESAEELQSSEVTQTASLESNTEAGAVIPIKLKTASKQNMAKSRPVLSHPIQAETSQSRGSKRKHSADTNSSKFRSSGKTKRYEEKPFADPAMERSRLNAINAKINRDRKKQEMELLNKKCDNLTSQNRDLSKNNRELEERLKKAEEEIAFLRQALLGGLARPQMDNALKSIFGGNSAPAGGVSDLGGKDI